MERGCPVTVADVLSESPSAGHRDYLLLKDVIDRLLSLKASSLLPRPWASDTGPYGT